MTASPYTYSCSSARQFARKHGAYWRLEDLRSLISGDRLTAVGMAMFESTGYTEDGKAFDRLGRATLVLGRQAMGEEWVVQHTDVSLFPGTPPAPLARCRITRLLYRATAR